MNILHLIYTNGVAGAEKYLLHLLPPLREKGYNCHVTLVCAPGSEALLTNYMNLMKASGVPITMIVTRRAGFFGTARTIRNYLQQHNIKVVHSHLLNSDVLATIVKLFFVPSLIIISTKHGYNEKVLKDLSYSTDPKILKGAPKDFYSAVTKFVIKKIDFNYAVSKATAHLYYHLGLSKEMMPYIHHGVKVKQVSDSYDVNSFRLAAKQIITVGRLEVIKGHKYLLEAMPVILEKYPGIKLLIIGEGSERSNLESLSVQLNLQKSVSFLGFNNDPYTYVKNSDVVVIPSLFEPFGLVYIEAFALNTPVVAFDTAAGNEIIENNVTGLLAIPRNSKDLAHKILELLNEPPRAIAIADAALKSYLQNFSTERMVNDTAAYYENVKKISHIS